MTLRSEENFSSDNTSTENKNASVIGNGVSGNSSNYATEVAATVPENILHRYSSYTYRITLFFLTSKDFNELAANPSSFMPKYSLISSGAGFATKMADLVRQETTTGTANYDQTLRHPDFQTDFFIDNLSIETVVGLNAKNKASNAIDISFTITEPYGLSLLDRLLSACETSDDRATNYMSQPYLLQIDLLASPTDEELLRSRQTNNVISTKKIAIKLLEMKIKPTGSGSTYSVRAIPYNHSAFDTASASLPVPMNIEAGTVGEFFSSDDEIEKIITGQISANEERAESETNKWIAERSGIFSTVTMGSTTLNFKPTAEQIENQKRAYKQGQIFKTKSLPAAYNVYNEKIAKEKKLAALPPTKIIFNIPNDEIANSLIVNPDSSSSGDVRLQDTSTGYNKPDDSSGYKNKQNFSFNAGTSIIDIVDSVMRKSDYIKKQIQTAGSQTNELTAQAEYVGGNERTGDEKQAKKLNWFKLLPTVALNDFDATTNTYSKTILYSILPYTAANFYHPNFAQVNSSSVANQVVRTYDYLFTGKNQDILRLDVDFDTSFYTLVTTKGDQVGRSGNDAGSDNTATDVDKDKFAVGKSAVTNLPVETRFAGSNKSSVGTAKATDPEEQVVADLTGSLYTRQRGDALNLKLQIIGDPDFIKQDDVFINAGSPDEYNKFLASRLANNSQRPIADNGQILFDAEQVYVRVNVKNSIDINDSIGIVNKQEILSNGRQTDGSFSGVYKVLTVQSEFNRGQFTQTLDLIRIPDALDPPKKPAQNQAALPTANETVDKDAEAKRGIFANPTPITPQPVTATQIPTTPTQPSQVAEVKPPLTFAQAFAQARKDFGNKPGGVFEWRGKLYQTNYQNEPYVANPVPVYPGANE